MPALPPLVEPGHRLTPDQIERYSRHLLLAEIGDIGQRRLLAARVLVVGAGGLGSPVLTYLAAAGVGTLGIVDSDVVERSNLQRQTIHTTDTVGMPKTASAARSIAALNPDITVIEHPVRLTSDNARDLLTGYDLVVDGADNFPTRYLVSDACSLAGIPCVWGSVLQFEGQLSVFWAGHGPTYRDVFPLPPPPGSVPSCGEAGVVGVVCATIGSGMAAEVIKLVCGIGEPLLGRLQLHDTLRSSVRWVTVRPDPAAEPVKTLTDDDAFCAVPPPVEPATDERGRWSLPPPALAAELAGEGNLTLVDVREPAEFALAALPGARNIPLGDITSGRALAALRLLVQDGRLALYCRSGARSATARSALISAGIDGALELEGGYLAWVRDIDPELPRY